MFNIEKELINELPSEDLKKYELYFNSLNSVSHNRNSLSNRELRKEHRNISLISDYTFMSYYLLRGEYILDSKFRRSSFNPAFKFK